MYLYCMCLLHILNHLPFLLEFQTKFVCDFIKNILEITVVPKMIKVRKLNFQGKNIEISSKLVN